ncbi:MAG: response regulator [Desulfobacteraceae bacterium]
MFNVCLHEVVVSRKRKKIKVLVIEDDLNMCIYLCNLLRADGFDPCDAQNRVAGIEKIRSEKPALIVLDGMLPDEESIAIYYRLKSDPELQHIPVVMMASIDQRTFCYYQRCQQLQHPVKVPDPEAFLTKPPEAEEFLTTVKRLVESPPVSQRKAP